MTYQPLVSVITPCYNHAEFVEETIKSVLAQDYPNIEHIVVDGGSTDGSVEIIRKYQDRIAKWVSEPDEGQSDAINKGFRMATGEILAWLNSDDLYFPDAVSTAVRRFRERPDLTLFYGNCVFVSRQGQFVRYFTEVESYDEFRLRNCSDYIMQPTTFFKRDKLFEVGLLDETLGFGMDWDLWCRFAKSGCTVHYEPKLIAANRAHGSTKTATGSVLRLREIWRILRRHKTAIWPHGVFNYGVGHLRTMTHMISNPLARGLLANPLGKVLLYVGQVALSLGNLRNILYARRHTKPIHGLVPHSKACFRQARIRMPVYRPLRGLLLLAVECLLTTLDEPDQVMHVRINGQARAPIKFNRDSTPQCFSIDLPESVADTNVLDVTLEFGRTYRRNVAAYVHGVFLV